MTRQETLATMVQTSRDLLYRYLVGFDDTNHTKQAANVPNHVAWTLGHLALTMCRCAERLDNGPLSDKHFKMGLGGTACYDPESVAFASKPVDDPEKYPSLAGCREIFDAAVKRLADATRNADDAMLDSPQKWGPVESPMFMLVGRMVYHTGYHTGQIADLRRALGMGSIFK